MKHSLLAASVIVTACFTTAANAQFLDQIGSSDSHYNTGIGSYTLFNLTSANESSYGCTTNGTASSGPFVCEGNTAAGISALNATTTGSFNTGLGLSAGYSNSTGSYNTAVGMNALLYNTYGLSNTAVGSLAMSATPAANYSTAVGFSALSSSQAADYNTAIGAYALANSTTTSNTAVGYSALEAETSGGYNTAVGGSALSAVTTGSFNAAFGMWALQSSNGSANTAIGNSALKYSTGGSNNTAVGSNALFGDEADSSLSTGGNNTAVGAAALQNDEDGAGNAAVGFNALLSNTSGANNTALGDAALYSNTLGKGNAAQGTNALYNNTVGIRNLGIGSNALFGNVSGSYNVGLGFDAGYNATGDDNIYVNNAGVSGESQTLRLGTQGTAGVLGSGILTAYVAGVATTQVTGSAVYITSSGQLGVLASSERFKTDVQPLGTKSDGLSELRPVTFKLKTDGQGTLQYGLIAEEVAKVYPELVLHGADGRIDGVRYEELTPLLLNLVQQQNAKISWLTHDVETAQLQLAQVRELREQVAQLNELTRSMAAALRGVQANGSALVQPPQTH